MAFHHSHTRRHSIFSAERWLLTEFSENEWLYLDPAIYPAWHAKCEASGTNWKLFSEVQNEWNLRLAAMKYCLWDKYWLLVHVQNCDDLDERTRFAWYLQILAATDTPACVVRLKNRLTRLLYCLRTQGYLKNQKCKPPGKRIQNVTLQVV